ncbi:MAG: hypothetical protein Q8O67_21000 [Deltaproteobacteria bacterium]|nr:hypothetical protein [Deltaproteobacteria bacterium]
MTDDDKATAAGTAGDEDLEDFVRTQAPQRAVHPVRVVLAVAAVVAVAWILGPTTDELTFHFSQQRVPLDTGDVTGVDLSRIPDGTWVRASVILGNKAAEIPEWRPGSLRFGPIEVREVVGAPLFVEVDRKKHPSLGPFSQTDVEGRLVSFGPESELKDVRAYFNQDLRTPVPATARALILDEAPGGMSLYLGAWIAGVSLVVLSFTSILRRVLARRSSLPSGRAGENGAAKP